MQNTPNIANTETYVSVNRHFSVFLFTILQAMIPKCILIAQK